MQSRESLAIGQHSNWISHFIICAELSPYCDKKRKCNKDFSNDYMGNLVNFNT